MRPNWDEYFLSMAFLVSTRSHDIHTKHGAVIVDGGNRVIGVGYNGFPRHFDDGNLPVERPDKYAYMIHAEENAINNCAVRPYYIGGATAYVTGQCCSKCGRTLIQNGVTRIVMGNKSSNMINGDDISVFKRLVAESSILVKYMTLNKQRILHLFTETLGLQNEGDI